MAKLIALPGSRPENEGEALVVSHLRESLPATYTLVPNVEIAERGRPPFEYDLIVIAPHAVYVVEIKRWLGGIRGDDYTWQVAGRHLRDNPWPTANNKARVLKSQILRRQPACGGLWVEAVVAIADDEGELDLRGNCRARTFRFTDLPAFLTDASVLGNESRDLRPLRAYIEKAVQEAARGRSQETLHFGDYEVLEKLSRRDRVSEYLARNVLLRGSARLRLRVFSYDPYLPEDEQGRRRESISRDAEALQSIGRHPNLIESLAFFADPRDPGLFVEVTDWSEAGTLRTVMTGDVPLSLERKVELARGISAGLKAAHGAGVVHRDLRPENILIGSDGQPRVMNFEYARMPVAAAGTVSPFERDPDVPRAYLAPELLRPDLKATPAADLYALGALLFEMLVGTPPYQSPEEAVRAGDSAARPIARGALDVPGRLDELVRRLTNARPEDRIQTADEVLTALQAILERPSGTVAEVEPAGPLPEVIEPAVFRVGDLIDLKYQVQGVLPPGGSGQVYKVYDSVFDRVNALKVLNDTAGSLVWLTTEARAVLGLDHPNIVKVHSWGKLPSGRLYLVSDFVEGEDLTAYTSGAKRMSVAQAVECITQLLSALAAMHPDVERISELKAKADEGEIAAEEYDELGDLEQLGWLHRDIKPANLMLSGQMLKLIDFNIAAHARDVDRTFTGTLGYMPPDVGLVRWDTSFDLFAVGIVLYELVTGHHPYPDRTPNVEDPPADPREFVPSLSPRLTDLLLRAVSVDRDVRFESARRFRRELAACEPYLVEAPADWRPFQVALEAWERGKANYNPYVTRMLTLYSQARRDNSGTRGLDQIGQLTYVETRLDRVLRPAVLDGQYRLVIITGNAGDGKTTFIKTLENEVRDHGSVVKQTTTNSSTFEYRGRKFVTNYDGSQDEGHERVNDLVLTEFFAPFADDAVPEGDSIHLIAINEGRLVDFFGAPDREQFSGLGRRILGALSGDGDLPPWMLIVDLNRRSVVAPDSGAGDLSIMERQLASMVQPDLWAPCNTCEWRGSCFIKFNADTLSDPVSGSAVRERVRTLFEVVHLRRQLHITMRDMRSALSWLLLQDHSCNDVAELLSGAPSPERALRLYYYNAFAHSEPPAQGHSGDRLVELMREIDPAESASPTLDRQLYFMRYENLGMMEFAGRSTADDELLRSARQGLPQGWGAAQRVDALTQHHAYHGALRRKAYFEQRSDEWLTMLPYRNLAIFRRAITSSEYNDLPGLKVDLIQGLSMAEGALNGELARRYVCLRAGQDDKQKIKSFRLFPVDDFVLEVEALDKVASLFVEYTADHLILFHNPQDKADRVRGSRRAELYVSLDVLELLAEIRAGFVPSPNDIRGHYINLVIFKNALTHLPYRRALLTRDDRTFYELTLEGIGTAVLRRVDDGSTIGVGTEYAQASAHNRM